MSSCSNAQSTKVGFGKNETAVLSTGNPERAWISGEDREEEEEEDEDADFNPFQKDTPSQEASSSLSSEVDGLDGVVVSSGLSVGVNMAELASKEQICASGGIEHGDEEIIMQSTVIPNETCDQELKKNATCNSLKRKSALISQLEIETDGEKDSGLSSKTEGNDVWIGELSNSTKSQGPVIEIDNEDAICMRTRARYSLASFSLDELETFLQETDDDDDLQNVDDEEEYRKFLTAVLHGGDGDSLSARENENVDDEDEDNDADFEIELEELLESDVDENASVKTRKEHDGAGRRPETRQNRRQKASTQHEKKSLGQVKRPLRPLLPSLRTGPLAPAKTLMPEGSLSFQSSASGSGLVNGFTSQQIGQLHSLIHEHVQLLIQVFSLSILDPSRQHIASQVQGLLFEMLHKRDEVLALKSVPYPSICFSLSYIGSSVSDGNAKVSLAHCSIESSSMCDTQRSFLPQSNVGPSDGRCEYISNRQRSSFQEIEGSSWFPFVRGPVISILDVSPISLVGRYVEDVHSAVQESRKRYLESACDTRVEKEPLFPCFPSIPESSSEVSSVVSKAVNTTPTSPNQQQPKKTLAAMLVESTKKQSIALVPKEIAKLAQRFLPLFNPALFPHKPPLPAVVNRVLFTDSEDVLLALGLMEYNTDWKAIQQRFLPCKSKHQIFVRQKNRCSSKAPENPIKAVRRMKTSPLTKEEVACIQEGLKVYKFDWMSVWKFIVPYRDPSLLPRQWRIALGTQKSYKQDASKREKRRLYEAKRRKLKSAASESWHAISDKEDCQTEIVGEEISGAENCTDNSGIAYVHQAFLADWRPDTCTPNCTGRIPPNSIEENHVNDAMPQEDTHYRVQQIGYGVCGKAQSQNKSTLSSVSQHLHTSSNKLVMEPRNPVFNVPTSTSKYYYRPYRSRRVNSTHLVKLAPDLPPVNLPPSVRIVSQTAFEGHQCKTSKIYPAGSGVVTGRKDDCASHEKFGIVHSVKGARMQDSVAGSQLETGRPGTVRGRSVVAENGTNTDLQMHPLLFQAPEDGSAAYYPLKFSTGSSSSFSFFSGTQPQLNLSLFHNPHQQSSVDCSTRSLRSSSSTSRSGGIDFHPLLQKSNDTQFQTGFDTVQTESLVNDGVAANGSSSVEKSNDLDLEIHLSSASGRGKSIKSKELKVHEPMASTKAVAICRTSTKPQEINAALCSLLGGKNLTGSSSKLDSCARSLVVSNDNVSSCDVDDIGDQSHPEIVMEQEELSDSEEDIEENVEFECEEMADSEGEDGSGCEQTLEGQNKEISTPLREVATHAAGKENPCEPGANSDPQVDDSLPTNNTNTYKIAQTSERNDKSNSSWLSLDSGTADDPVLLKTQNDRATIGEVPTSENVALSRPSRCSKKTKSCSKGVTEERHNMDMVQQLSLGSLAFAAPRKPRKRSSKSNASLNIGLTVKSSSHDNNHNDG